MADWSYVQDFEGYTAAPTTLGGQDSWSGSDAECTVQTATPLQGTKSVRMNGSVGICERVVTTAASGIFYFMMQCHTAPTAGDGGNVSFRINTGGNYVTVLKFDQASGNLQYYSSGAYATLVTTYTLDTLYWIGIDLASLAASSQFKIRVGTSGGWSGAWSSDLATGSASTNSVDNIEFSQDTGDSFFDNFTLTDPFSAVGPTNLKSLNTNLKANIKSYNGNVVANIKSINTNV